MANSDGLASAMANRGNNKIQKFDGGYFSFAFGNEIALCLEGDYYILNCGEELWDEVLARIDENTSVKEAVNFWLYMSKEYDCSVWSNSFSDLAGKV